LVQRLEHKIETSDPEAEPGPEFPENRENNREFPEFWACSAIPDLNSPSNSKTLRKDSLLERNRVFFAPKQGIS